MLNRKRTNTIVIMAIGLLFVSGPAFAGDITPAQRAEFHKLVNQRNDLERKLLKLDRQASKKIKSGEKPVVIYAGQTAMQDKLDLVEQRMEILSVRYDLAIPARPAAGSDALDARTNRRVNQAFERGRHRAMQRIRQDCLQMLR